MEFEKQFMVTPGATLGAMQCYEARKLHRENLHVRRSLEALSESD